jgi:hypothetical protein
VLGVLHNIADQGHPAGDGASDLGQEDCHHRAELTRQVESLPSPVARVQFREALDVESGVTSPCGKVAV